MVNDACLISKHLIKVEKLGAKLLFSTLRFINERFYFQNVVESEVSSLPLGEQHDAADFIIMLLTKNHPEDTGYEAVVEYIQQCMTCQKVHLICFILRKVYLFV